MTPWPGGLEKYRVILSAFLDGRLSGDDVQTLYFFVYPRDDQRDLGAGPVLEELSYDMEDFVADPSLREPGDLDEDALRVAVATALAELQALTSASAPGGNNPPPADADHRG